MALMKVDSFLKIVSLNLLQSTGNGDEHFLMPSNRIETTAAIIY